MRFTQIRDETVIPGGLVEWTPYVPGGLGAWHHDSRLTSHNHEQHLRSAFEYRLRTKREGGREAWLGLSIEFDEPLSIPAIRATLTQWIDRHEVLRSHVVIKGDGLQRLSTPPGTVKLKMGRVGWYSASGPLVEQLAGAFDRATAPLHWPAYMFATVAREDSFTLLFAADHSLVDGYSLIMAQDELTTIYRAARERRRPELPPVGSYVDFSAQERRDADQNGSDHPAVVSWDAFLRSGHGGMPGFELDIVAPEVMARSDGAVAQQSIYGLLLDNAATNRFTAVCSQAGGTLTAGILAAFAMIYRKHTGDAQFRCVLPRHTRDDRRWLTALGWFVGLAPFCVEMSDDPTFDQTIVRATTELKRSRVGATLPFLRIAELLGRPVEPRFAISFIDTRYAGGAAEADAGRSTVLRSHSYAPLEVFIWINRTPGGLRVSARFPPDVYLPPVPPVAEPAGSTPGVNNPTLSADNTPSGTDAAGPVQSYLRDFAELLREIGDTSTFSTHR